jgi:hypothetical protein
MGRAKMGVWDRPREQHMRLRVLWNGIGIWFMELRIDMAYDG